MSPDISGKVIHGYLGIGKAANVGSTWDTLTHREREVLKLVAEGHPNKYIADYLCLSIKTVEKHRQKVMEKLKIHDTASLTRYAVSSGIVESGVP